jgi:hypothetical protein
MMLITPYAEVFGYSVSPKFLVITMGSHAIYGLVLWLSLRRFDLVAARDHKPTRSGWKTVLTFLPAPIGVSLVGVAFFVQHSASIPPSPPPILGGHLYVTWTAPEPDRVAAIWVLKRFVDPDAQLYFIEPFSHFSLGNSFDMPESDVRRSGTNSATVELMTKYHIESNEKLELLCRMADLFEVAQWMRPSDPEANDFGVRLLESMDHCDDLSTAECFGLGIEFLDGWYDNRWD